MATIFAGRAFPSAPACTDPDRDYIYRPERPDDNNPDFPQPEPDGLPLIQFPLPETFVPDILTPEEPAGVLSGSRRLC